MPVLRSAQVVNVPNKVDETVAITTTRQLSARPFVCVSRDEEEAFYQPMRAVAALVLGPALLFAARKLPSDQGALKLLSACSGLWLIGYNSLRHYEIRSEMARYDASQGNT